VSFFEAVYQGGPPFAGTVDGVWWNRIENADTWLISARGIPCEGKIGRLFIILKLITILFRK
jgi:hypothetical protein